MTLEEVDGIDDRPVSIKLNTSRGSLSVGKRHFTVLKSWFTLDEDKPPGLRSDM
jgi:hypothetical protein